MKSSALLMKACARGPRFCQWKPDIEATRNLVSHVIFPPRIPHMRLRDDSRTTCVYILLRTSVLRWQSGCGTSSWHTTCLVAALVRGKSNLTCHLRDCSLLEACCGPKQMIYRMDHIMEGTPCGGVEGIIERLPTYQINCCHSGALQAT